MATFMSVSNGDGLPGGYICEINIQTKYHIQMCLLYHKYIQYMYSHVCMDIEHA